MALCKRSLYFVVQWLKHLHFMSALRISPLYREMWDTHQRHVEEQRTREQARLILERANPKIVETGTYIGPVKGASLCVWRDQFGYTHTASAWMQNLAPSQKFIDGKVVDLPQGVGGSWRR